jgi:hypothetical protein
MEPTIIFIPTKYTHWEMYLPLIESLQVKGINTCFMLLKDIVPNVQTYESIDIKKLNNWLPEIKEKGPFSHRLKLFYVVYKELIPLWINYLKNLEKGAVVVAQDGAPIQRLLLNSAKQYGFKRVTMQDGFFVSQPRKYGWQLQRGYKVLLKRFLTKTPLEVFITKGFGVASDFCGLYGRLVKERLCKSGNISENKASVIGSPRHAIFRKRVASLLVEKDEAEVRILCMPTTFPMYRDQRLQESQDKALKWLIDSVITLSSNSSRRIYIDLKIKRGYDHQSNHYKKLLDHPAVNILLGSARIEELFATSDLVVTTGSTAALEAAVCGKPVLQIMPPYLCKRFITIQGIPVAKDNNDLKRYLEKMIGTEKTSLKVNPEVYGELADINPQWDSITETTNWLCNIVKQ